MNSTMSKEKYTAKMLTEELVSQFTETEFVQFLRDNRIKFNKKYDDIIVDGDIYQFGRDGRLITYDNVR